MVKNIDYQAKKLALEAIVTWFESGDVQIDEALAKYEQAEVLINELEAYLKNTKLKIDKLIKQTVPKNK